MAVLTELKPVKLIYISDVPGIMKDPSDPSTLITSVTRTEALDLIKDGTVSGGMLPKIHSAIDALNAGVRKVHFIDGRPVSYTHLDVYKRQVFPISRFRGRATLSRTLRASASCMWRRSPRTWRVMESAPPLCAA